jgi:hypothetical protein
LNSTFWGNPKTQKNGSYVLTLPTSGFLQTSSALESGYAHDQYFYVVDSGRRNELREAEKADDPSGMIWGRQMFAVSKLGMTERTFIAFFVGPLSAYSKAPKELSSMPVP